MKINQRVGKLVWVSRTDERDSRGNLLWIVKCDCGNELKISSDSGNNRISCGCIKQEEKDNIVKQRELQSLTGNKYCTACKDYHNISEFPKHAKSWDGLYSQCRKVCSEKSKLWRKSNPEKARDGDLRKKTGVTLEQKQAKIEEQNGLCAICGTDTPGGKYNDWHTDHDHITGKFRGCLCHYCNTALGLVKDNPDTLRRMISYLER